MFNIFSNILLFFSFIFDHIQNAALNPININPTPMSWKPVNFVVLIVL